MQTSLSVEFKDSRIGKEADEILRKCVHCGFCNATCPTYQLLGDELDGPRGRIYQIKQLVEGTPADKEINLHLDRCLTCRNCETTCPSGVEYSKLLDIGRRITRHHINRPLRQSIFREALGCLLRKPALFRAALRLGRLIRPLLPSEMKSKIPLRTPSVKLQWPKNTHTRLMIGLAGCAQSGLAPQTNVATAIVLDRLGITLKDVAGAGCCGSVDLHTTSEARGAAVARQLIDRWWPELEKGVETFVMTASGCGLSVREYPQLFKDDPEYCEKAVAIASKTQDLSEVLDEEIAADYRVKNNSQKIAFHSPCTLQHGQKLTGRVESILRRVGYHLTDVPDSHLCCGSAGTYSLLQPKLSNQLKTQKLVALESGNPDQICTANIGCQSHLATSSSKPIKHWVELLL